MFLHFTYLIHAFMATEGKTKIKCSPTSQLHFIKACSSIPIQPFQFRCDFGRNWPVDKWHLCRQVVDDMAICEPRMPLPIKVTPIHLRSTVNNVLNLLVPVWQVYWFWCWFYGSTRAMRKELHSTTSFSVHPKTVLAACHWSHKVIEWHLRNFLLHFFHWTVL